MSVLLNGYSSALIFNISNSAAFAIVSTLVYSSITNGFTPTCSNAKPQPKNDLSACIPFCCVIYLSVQDSQNGNNFLNWEYGPSWNIC